MKWFKEINTLEELRKLVVKYPPDDDYLYMVSAKKDDGTFAVWTSWNEAIQSLNYGHYDLSSVEDCERLFNKFYYIE